MNELQRHLSQNVTEIFPLDEMNEVIAGVYNIIKRAVRDEADTLTLTPSAFIWSKGGRRIGQFQIKTKPTMSFLEALEKIIERDNIVRSHCHLLKKMEKEITYTIER